jgi:Protein of unknown function (DUF3112)
MLRALQARSGGPYPSNSAGLGGLPTVSMDVPICAVFILLYLCLAVTNSTIFRKNLRKQHKFMLSILLTGFCMARVGTLVLRISWANRQHNIRLAIAAQIFVNVGILFIYIVNLVLAQRILRAKQPDIGWHPMVRIAYKILYGSIGVALVIVISSVVISVYSLNTDTRSICRDIQLAALTYLLCFVCLPLIHFAAAFLLPRQEEDNFGLGSMRSKTMILAISTCLCILIAGFRAGATWSPPRPVANPAWYDSKACFYVFNFTLEICILCTLVFGRIDQRFYIPNGCNKAGDYTRLQQNLAVDGMSGDGSEGIKEKGEMGYENGRHVFK